MTWVISCPVWGDDYAQVFLKATLPSILVALKRANSVGRFLVFSDREFPDKLFEGHVVEHFPVPQASRHHYSMNEAHRQTLERAGPGNRVFMGNADIIPSGNAFSFAENIFQRGHKAVISIAIRAKWLGYAPIGEEPERLLDWVWSNRHEIIEDQVWHRGTSRLTTMLFFEEEENVVLHSFYPYPMMLVKDREYKLKNTIDDDMGYNYQSDELYFAFDRQCSFAEISLPHKTAPTGGYVDLQALRDHAHRPRYKPWHHGCFARPYRVCGDGEIPGTAEIVARILE